MRLFEVSELINVAVKDEETGIEFYSALADATKTPEIKEAILAIAEQEKAHRDRFKDMLTQVGDYKPREEYAGQYGEYLKVLLESRAFPEPSAAAEKARGVGSDAEAIDIALGLEKDTLLFLQEMKGLVPESNADLVEEIIKEEREHVVDLTNLRTKLQ